MTQRVSVILAHPDPSSLNHAIAAAAVDELGRRGHLLTYHDLYAEGFDPLLTASEIPTLAEPPRVVAGHCEEISCADGIVIVHPNWWGGPPAILKGWIDRVLRPGVAYRFLETDSGDGVPLGLLRARAALVFNTSNTAAVREHETFGDPLESFWRSCVFGLCGIERFYRETFRVVVTSNPEQRAAWLLAVKQAVGHYFPREN